MLATKEERDLILDMLASGKIEIQEARDLFDAVERCALEESERQEVDSIEMDLSPAAVSELEFDDDQPWSEFAGGIVRAARHGVRRAAQAIQSPALWDVRF